MRSSEGRILWWMMAAIVILAVLCLNSGCQTLAGAGRDLTAASEGMSRAAAER